MTATPARPSRANQRLGLAGLLALLLTGACKTPPTGQYRGTYQQAEVGDIDRQTGINFVEGSIQDQFGEDSRVRGDVRAFRTDSRTESDGTSVSETNTLIHPSLDAVLAFAALRWIQGYDFQERTQSSSEGFANELSRRQMLQKLAWSPHGLPEVAAWVDLRDFEDNRGLDQQRIRYVLDVRDRRGPFSFEYLGERRDTTQAQDDFERSITQHVFRGVYRENHFRGALSTTVNVFLEELSGEERFSSSGGSPVPPGEVVPTVGLSAVEPDPQITILDNNPGLIDQNLEQSAGINIGGFSSGGQLDWNIGAGFATQEVTNLALLSTAEEVDFIFQQQFGFSVWASDDNNFWTLVTPSATVTYEFAFRRFRLQYPETSSRFIKVVNDQGPALAPAILVTELASFGPAGPVSPDTTERDQERSVRTLQATVAWRPTETLTLGTDGIAQTRMRTSDDILTEDLRRLDLGFSALWSPIPLLDFNLRAFGRRIEDPGVIDEEFRLLNGLVILNALQNLDFTLKLTHNETDLFGENTRDNNAARIGTNARLLDTLSAELAYEYNVLDDFANQRKTTSNIWSGRLIAELTKDLDFTVELLENLATITGAGAEVAANPSVTNVLGQLTYSPVPGLTAFARLQWRDDSEGAGLNQRYRIDWFPIPGGPLDVELAFDRESREVFDLIVNRYLLFMTYRFSNRAFFQIQYLREDPNEGPRSQIVSVVLNVGA